MGDPVSLIQVVRPAEGGIQTHVAGLAMRLPPSRFTQMVAGPLSREFQAALSRADVSWAALPVPAVPSPRATRAAARQLRRLVERRGVQIVHAHGYVAGIVAAWALRGLRPRPRLVLTAHIVPDPPTGPDRAGFVQAWGYRWLLRHVDRGIAVSHAVRDALLAYYPAVGSRWRVIYNGIDPRPFRRRVDPGAKRKELGVDPAAAVVGTVARLSEEKGVDIFLRAAAIVSRQVPNVDFVVVGGGSARDELEHLAHTLRLTGQVLFLGRRRDVAQILPALDVLVVPSREESFGLAALEGIAAGVPVIASDVAGLREVFEGTSLVELVPSGDPASLANAIKRELTKVSYDETEAADLALPGGGISSLADMLVSQTEFDLDATGLERRQQATAATKVSERQQLLDRFDVRHMVHATIAVYDDLLRESA